MLDDTNLAAYDNLPGVRLVDYKRIGLPVYLAHIDVLIEERRDLHLISEYCLRLVGAGVARFDELFGLLGLAPQVVRAALADLLRGGALRGDEDCLSITSVGEGLLADYGEMICIEATWYVPYDGVLRKAYPWRRDQLLTGRQLLDVGHHTEFGPFGERPTARDLDSNDVWQVLASMRPEKPLDRLISVRNVRRAPLRFVPATALAYKGEKGAIQLAFLVDGRPLESHSHAFARNNGLKRTAFRELGEVDSPAARLRGSARRRLLRQPTALQNKASSRISVNGRITLPERRNDPGADVFTPPVYSLTAKFADALKGASSRVIVTSRTVTAGVAYTAFIRAVAALLEREVHVYVGLSPETISLADGGAALNKPLEALRQLGLGSDFLHVQAISDLTQTHLIVDARRLIVGDYDWLSPDGTISRTFRERWFIESEVPEIIDREALRVLSLMA